MATLAKLKQRVVALFKEEEPEKPMEPVISPELQRINDLSREIQMLKIALVGENMEGIPSGMLRIILKQNQEIYWAIKEDEIGKNVLELINELTKRFDKLERKEVLETVREQVTSEIKDIEEQTLRKKIINLLSEYDRLTSSDISILLGEPIENLDEIINNMNYENIIKKEKIGNFTYFILSSEI